MSSQTFLFRLECRCGREIKRNDRVCMMCDTTTSIELVRCFDEQKFFHWMIYQKWQPKYKAETETETTAVARLFCDVCKSEVKAADRRCGECGLFCGVKLLCEEVLTSFEHKHEWTLHRYAAAVDLPKGEGVVVISSTAQKHPPANNQIVATTPRTKPENNLVLRRKIMRMRNNGISVRKIAEKLGITKSRVEWLMERTPAQLKKSKK